MKTLLHWDHWIQTLINSGMANPLNDKLMMLLSAEWPWILIVLVFLSQILRQKDWMRLSAFLWLGMTIGISDSLSHFVIKPWVGRIRPCRLEGFVRVVDGCAGYYSFPSNHAANAAVFATLWFLLFSRSQGQWAIVCALFIGISRVYLGVHYPSDILGGYLFGFTLGTLAYVIWQKFPKKCLEAWLTRSRS